MYFRLYSEYIELGFKNDLLSLARKKGYLMIK